MWFRVSWGRWSRSTPFTVDPVVGPFKVGNCLTASNPHIFPTLCSDCQSPFRCSLSLPPSAGARPHLCFFCPSTHLPYAVSSAHRARSDKIITRCPLVCALIFTEDYNYILLNTLADGSQSYDRHTTSKDNSRRA